MRRLAFYVLLFIVMVYVLNQARKPTKWFGRVFVRAMNLAHSALTDWGLGHVQIKQEFAILDVGCGGGQTIQKLAYLAPMGIVCGVDYAKGSLVESRARNKELINEGRVEIQQASVSELPFPDSKFDLVTAIETQYYWPDLVRDMQEILRVLKPAGTLLVIAETYKGGRYGVIKGIVMKLLRSAHLSADEHRELFSAAGYADVQIFEEYKKGWICGIGRRPLPNTVAQPNAI